MGYYASEIIELALAEIGYLEKASNENLDDKTANAGSGNYTKYARDIDKISGFYNGKKNGYHWCDVFVDWLFVKKYGAEAAKKLLCQPGYSCGAGCTYSSSYYKQKGQFYKSNPKPGDQIFFYNSKKTEIIHTGLVYKVDNTYVYTIEGNTSSSSGVISNGGAVEKKQYKLNYYRIYGYGRPEYDAEPVTKVETPAKAETPAKTESYSLTVFIKDVQKATGAKVDGIAGPETFSKTITVSAKYNRKHAVVKFIQKRLMVLGYAEVGEADGIAGPKFTAAITRFQKDNGCVSDGIISARNKTWKKLLGMA